MLRLVHPHKCPELGIPTAFSSVSIMWGEGAGKELVPSPWEWARGRPAARGVGAGPGLMGRFTFLESPASHDLPALMAGEKNDPFAAAAAVGKDCGKCFSPEPVCPCPGFPSRLLHPCGVPGPRLVPAMLQEHPRSFRHQAGQGINSHPISKLQPCLWAPLVTTIALHGVISLFLHLPLCSSKTPSYCQHPQAGKVPSLGDVPSIKGAGFALHH